MPPLQWSAFCRPHRCARFRRSKVFIITSIGKMLTDSQTVSLDQLSCCASEHCVVPFHDTTFGLSGSYQRKRPPAPPLSSPPPPPPHVGLECKVRQECVSDRCVVVPSMVGLAEHLRSEGATQTSGLGTWVEGNHQLLVMIQPAAPSTSLSSEVNPPPPACPGYRRRDPDLKPHRWWRLTAHCWTFRTMCAAALPRETCSTVGMPE